MQELRRGHLVAGGRGPAATGFEPIDTVLDGGLLPGELVLVGGQPGAGKTILALQWARYLAGRGRPVIYACYEHDEAALFHRLLVQELAVLDPAAEPGERIEARAVARELTLGTATMAEAMTRSPLVGHAVAGLERSLSHLLLLSASARATTADELVRQVDEQTGPGAVLIVDYLQKVPAAGGPSVEERVARTVEVMKELAVSRRVTVVALAAAGAKGIEAGRLRLHQLRGADALAHECDIALVLNDKATAVADHHLKFDLTRLDDARRRTVVSVEKNRRGEANLHLELTRDFANFRFEPRGAFLSEAMSDA
ncbi:MAG: AAA family ATPase [Acidimicrobiia bacterium]|nr:AAA family ATPase [Acidimicrobiia bacterium]